MAPRPPPPLTQAWLRAEAHRHMQRYEPTVVQLRRVLRRRVERGLRFHGGDRDEGHAMVEAVLSEFLASGWLDDARVARAWVDSWQRRGVARAAMRVRLRQKGIDGQIVDEALSSLGEDADLEGVIAYARRRRFGPFRVREADPRRELAAICRAGFPYGVARRVLDCADVDAVEALLTR